MSIFHGLRDFSYCYDIYIIVWSMVVFDWTVYLKCLLNMRNLLDIWMFTPMSLKHAYVPISRAHASSLRFFIVQLFLVCSSYLYFLFVLFCHVLFVLFCVLLYCLMHASVCISSSEALTSLTSSQQALIEINSFDQLVTKTYSRLRRFNRWLLYFNEWSGTVLNKEEKKKKTFHNPRTYSRGDVPLCWHGSSLQKERRNSADESASRK